MFLQSLQMISNTIYDIVNFNFIQRHTCREEVFSNFYCFPTGAEYTEIYSIVVYLGISEYIWVYLGITEYILTSSEASCTTNHFIFTIFTFFHFLAFPNQNIKKELNNWKYSWNCLAIKRKAPVWLFGNPYYCTSDLWRQKSTSWECVGECWQAVNRVNESLFSSHILKQNQITELVSIYLNISD